MSNKSRILPKEWDRLLEKSRTNIVFFAENLLGLPVSFHKGQTKWFKNSTRQINILRPGNKWGKSLAAAIKHIHHAATKPLLGTTMTPEEKLQAKYDTLNFGPGYEQAREVLRMARDVVQGNILIPEEFRPMWGTYNRSFFKDWFLVNDNADAKILPELKWATGTTLYGRSYDEMGGAFKMKALAYISGDECADVQELWTFTNGTLLPRLSTFRGGQLDYYGTPQPEGYDYQRMIEMAEEDMKKLDWEENGVFYTQKGSMYDNPFLPKETFEGFEKIMDPTMREQVIRGDFVQTGEKFFGFERIQHAVDIQLTLLDQGEAGRKYITSVDFAGGESVWADHTVVGVLDYTEPPFKLVYFNRVHGKDMPIPMQYGMVRDIVGRFPGKLIVDSSALGGKNAMAFLSDLMPISADFKPMGSSNYKSEMLAATKVMFDGADDEKFRRNKVKDPSGDWIDLNPNWGMVKIPNLPILVRELQNYKLEDGKLSTDCVMMLGMPLHWLHLRQPRKQPKRAIELDFLSV